MAVRVRSFVRTRLSPVEMSELRVVEGLARELAEHLESRDDDIAAAHVHGAQSKDIQSIVEALLVDQLGFGTEVILTPEDGLVTKARPDFVYRLADGRGILAEVERGGTVNNNHDLKDMWKAHIAVDAQHLFLVVPNSNWKHDGTPREKPFTRVVSRVGAFFGDERREIDVVSAHVFGYGETDHMA